MRAGSIYRAAVLVLAPLVAYGGAARKVPSGGVPLGKGDVDLRLVRVSATGRGGKPKFDRRIPKELKKRLLEAHLAYGKYDLIGLQACGAKFGRKVVFALPRAGSLAVTASPHSSRTRLLRLDIWMFEKGRKPPILRSQFRLLYGNALPLHLPKGASALIMGVSAHKPGDSPLK